ncbi:sigma-70 family RNA polymerase sigma factor [Pseudomonas sp. BP8]|uniref:sigma-70 family RNA polymerase sigma factor n=1 Tax=Pseudomonas sp. BP8 TaxID=2817864 RepID=UPI001AEAB338|nr:sigma-70 family RNA polymerase sigma factor [Pseudomonas sp. BP8]MBP2261802.1 RNA polymerase sigma-70 factor (ECF subfamily) [Pseudomonas sp. BP8]HDS1736720.1 sigma-70 family RNA polymerase sigma factor [Pseudomonas putida]
MLPTSDTRVCDVALLYRQQHSWLKNWLRHRLNCSQSAADLAQDTFMRLLAKEQVPQLHAPRTFLVKVAQSVLSNHYRRQKLERAYLEALAAMPEQVAPSLETQAILLETLIVLDAALDGLERPVREAFLLSQVDGLGHGEIAARLNVSITTVKRYIAKAGALCIMLDDSLDLP